jgi:cell division protein FtsB
VSAEHGSARDGTGRDGTGRATGHDVSGPARADGKRPPARPGRPLWWAAAVFLLVLLALAGGKSYRDLTAVREREAELEARLASTRAEIAAFERRLDRLRHDPVALERLAREELGMTRPGDVVIVLPPEEPAEAPPAPHTPAEAP